MSDIAIVDILRSIEQLKAMLSILQGQLQRLTAEKKDA